MTWLYKLYQIEDISEAESVSASFCKVLASHHDMDQMAIQHEREEKQRCVGRFLLEVLEIPAPSQISQVLFCDVFFL